MDGNATPALSSQFRAPLDRTGGC
ncbi:uncharacterized protein METZ01_LOCUS211733 [marine metagenome]|uniref:Uncharacterized protein n=1 Tax=marine metagenome TaxID=408172 RepID=A0A382F881_9ZZZZ